MAKNKFYAVARGFKPGIYDSWYGEDGAEVQVKEYPKPNFRGFKTLGEAKEWYAENKNMQPTYSKKRKTKPLKSETVTQVKSASKQAGREDTSSPTKGVPKPRKIVFYTDGGCFMNPGPGGYGIVCVKGKIRKEYSGGFRKTTNNRMELMACIVALKTVRAKYAITIYSDSKYVVDGISKGWAEKWQANDWKRAGQEIAENVDLWSELLKLCDKHTVNFKWVKGHAGNPENERCDKLAMAAMSKKGLPPDSNYEAGKTKIAP